jgi:hypothetical protein
VADTFISYRRRNSAAGGEIRLVTADDVGIAAAVARRRRQDGQR